MSWARPYIGYLPENCWTFVRDIYKEHLSIQLPEFSYVMVGDISSIVRTMETQATSPKWVQTFDPKDFSVVAMSKSQAIHHVGVYTSTDGGKVLHSYEGTAVIASDLLQLRRVGFKRVEFYDLPSTTNI